MTYLLQPLRRAAARLVVAGALLSLAVVSRAVPISAVQFSYTGQDATTFNTQSQTIGWLFTVTAPIKVTSLGIFDPLQDGLADPHAVGLWSSSGTLLGSTTVPEGTAATLDGMFRYSNVTPILLTPGHNYVVGAHYTGTNGGGSIDPDPADRDGALSPYYNYHETFAPAVTFLTARSSSQQTTGLQYPYYTPPIKSYPYMGPNFRYSPVPESLSAGAPALVLLGFLGWAARRRRRRA